MENNDIDFFKPIVRYCECCGMPISEMEWARFMGLCEICYREESMEYEKDY